jgi:hypothetical protein
MVRFFRWMMNLITNLFNKTLKEGRDFEVYPGNEFTGIRIVSGKYRNVIYQYDKIALKEEQLDMPILSFHYTIHESGKHSQEYLRNDAKFHNLIGDIAVSLLTSNVVEKENYESDREDYSEELGI